jgi:hypothetical protein
MSSGAVSRHLNGGGSLLVSCAPIDDDRNGDWTIEELWDMNDKFIAALEAAFDAGLERRASACAEFSGARKGSRYAQAVG